MDTTEWDVEEAMTILKIPASERALYARSVAYAQAPQGASWATANG